MAKITSRKDGDEFTVELTRAEMSYILRALDELDDNLTNGRIPEITKLRDEFDNAL